MDQNPTDDFRVNSLDETSDAEEHITRPPTQQEYEAELIKLSKMSPVDYENNRRRITETYGVRASETDKAVKKLKSSAAQDTANSFQAPKPWPTAVDGAALLDEMRAAFRKYCVLSDGVALIAGIWCLFAHSHGAFSISPILALQSPEKRCGKSTLLELISLLCPKPLVASNVTPASIFRAIEAHKPTLILDEADTFIHGKDELTGIINSGHKKRTATVVRTVGDDHETKIFSTWAPKVIAGIGSFPHTIQDRAIVIPMRRKSPDERVARFREAEAVSLNHLLRKAARWAQDHMQHLRDQTPALPPELNDRAQDNAFGILAVADTISDSVGQDARLALVQLAQEAAAQAEIPPNTQLLMDLREIFKDTAQADWTSSELITALCEIEESPWLTWHRGRPISAKALAGILRSFDIHNHKTSQARVYRAYDFEQLFTRYLGPV